MLAEILTIGDELCRGEIVDTNSSWLAAELWDLDITVGWMTSCRDVDADIRRALADAAARAGVVLVSGGLGPTEDDLTVDALAALLGVQAVVDEAARERMQARFARANFQLTPNNLRQVRVPAGARVYGNPAGLAPGFEVDVAGVPVLCVPGVPREMKAIFAASLRDRLIELRERGGAAERIARRVYRVFGLGESHIATRLEGALAGGAPATLHYQVKFPETLVKVVVRAAERSAAEAILERIDGEVRARLGEALYGVGEDALAAALGRALRAAGATCATAESCTGGLVGALITEVAGASQYFRGGAVAYANEEKVRQLGVAPATLAAHGAVSLECAEEMARGARERFAVDYAVAVTGIAGPDGGSPDKPVGTVCIAVAGPAAGPAPSKRFVWPGARDQVRQLAAWWAVALLLRGVQGGPRRE